MWSLPSPHPEVVNLVTTWASPSPGDFVPHLDLIAVDTFLDSPGTGDSEPICASPRSGDSGPHLGIIGTWLLVPHLSLTSLESICFFPIRLFSSIILDLNLFNSILFF